MRFFGEIRSFRHIAMIACGLCLLAGLIAVAPALAGEGWVRDYTFSDSLTPEERANLRGFEITPEFEREWSSRIKHFDTSKDDFPSRFDWRDSGIMTPVKAQGNCGSCWAFGTVAQIEAHYKLYYDVELDLSEQQIIYCNPYGSDCGGGWAGAVYYVARSYGLNREAAEPYTGTNSGACMQSSFLPFAHVDDWYGVSNNQAQIKAALMNGPVVCSMDASPEFEDYSNGCYDEQGYGTNHLVLIVGWDDRMCGDQGGWICKNSWGPGFGDAGYFEIQYSAGSIGSYAQQVEIVVPPISVDLVAPAPGAVMEEGDDVTIEWVTETQGPACNTVDIWVSYDNGPFSQRLAQGTPNDGSFVWTVVNHATEGLRFCVVANGSAESGYGISQAMTIIGHRTRYVSVDGSNQAPFESPATAANNITDAIMACTGNDTILVRGGTYVGSVTIDHPVRVLGGWSSDFSVRDTDLYPTIFDGAQTPFRVTSEGDGFTEIDGFVFRDCWGSLYSSPAFGRHAGAVRVMESAPTIKNCVFETCKTNLTNGYGTGGAIQVLGGAPLIEDCVFTGNRGNLGGAIAFFGSEGATIRGCEFTANTCFDSVSIEHLGATLYMIDASVRIEDSDFMDNGGAYRGAAVHADNTALEIADCDFRYNHSTYQGGAISVTGGSHDIRGSDFVGNIAGGGGAGAMGGADADWTLRNVLMADNRAGGLGGACGFQSAGSADVENCTFHGNASDAMFGALFVTGDHLRLQGCVVGENVGDGVGGGVTNSDIDYNVVFGNGTDFTGVSAGPNGLSRDPLLVDPAGGNYSPGLHSPCVDTGDPDPARLDPDGSLGDRGCYGGPGAAPLAPAMTTGLSILSVAGGLFDVDWDASADAGVTDYVIYSCPQTGFVPEAAAMIAIVEGDRTTYSGALTAGQWYTVAALGAGGEMGGLATPVQAPSGSIGVSDLPSVLAIGSISPNPFNPSTRIAFDLPARSHVELAIYDMRGRLVKGLIGGTMEAGRHEIDWNGRDDDGRQQSAGVYLMRLDAGGETRTAKMVMAK